MMSPIKSEPATTLLPTKREMRAPQIRRERMSRPSSSVPHQCWAEGVCSRLGRSMCAGSCGAIQGAKIAAKAKRTTRITPIAASGLCRATRGSEMARVDMLLDLPYLKLEFAVARDHLKIVAVRRDQAGSVRARGKSDEHIEMEVAQLMRRKSEIGADLCENLARFQPIFFCGGQGGMIFFENQQSRPIRSSYRAAPQFSHDHGGIADKAIHGLDALYVAVGAQLVH